MALMQEQQCSIFCLAAVSACCAPMPCCLSSCVQRVFRCGGGHWQFTLPALHGYLQGKLAEGRAIDYSGFVKALYASELNQQLRELGGHVVIADNHGKVSSTLYSLQRL